MESSDLKVDLAAGAVRLGRYKVLRLVGQGGMGDVFEAVDEDHGGRVALKTLRALDPDRLLLFKNEFRTVSRLFHPNLVQLYELSVSDGLWFFTMELIDGVALPRWLLSEGLHDSSDAIRTPEGSTVLPESGHVKTMPDAPRAIEGSFDTSADEPLSPPPGPMSALPRIVDVFGQLIDALDYLHGQGVVHQDLKPSNVLVRRDGVVRLLDFGLVRGIGETTPFRREGLVIGTPGYMSPEQWAGKPATPASDLFSLGCMLFYALTGELPFPKKSPIFIVAPKVESRARGVPQPIASVCHALLSSDPTRRPSLAEVRTALGLESRATKPIDMPKFVGRGAELEILRAAADRAHAGTPIVAEVEGVSGIGKSTLVRLFFAELPDPQRALHLRGRCYEREFVPYKALDGIIDQLAVRLGHMDELRRAELVPTWSSELAMVFPVLARVSGLAELSVSVSGVELRRRALEALLELFHRLARDHWLALEIDDLQWADDDSVAFLEKLLESPPRALVLVLLFRPDEARANAAVSQLLDAVSRLPPEQRTNVRLRPLEAVEAEELAAQTLRSLGLPTSLAPTIARESLGLPFLLEELAHAVAQRRDSSGAHAVGLDLALADRVRALPRAERTLVEVLAVANNPIPLSIASQAATLSSDALPALSALHRGHLIHSAGVRAEDRVAIYHDRMRESVLASLSDHQTATHHLALGRALARQVTQGSWIFDTVRHLKAASALMTDPSERLDAARLHLEAGRQARRAAAFPLAYRCFEDGVELLPPNHFRDQYELSLGLCSGAAEAAYLTAKWERMALRVEQVTTSARTTLDQLTAREVAIDAFVGRHEYLQAIETGLEVLGLLGVSLPKDPTEAEVGAAFQGALASLNRVGPEGLASIPDATDPEVLAAMRIQVRLSPAAYFAKPLLLPIIACSLIQSSIDKGLSPATPNALAIFGIILNTVDLYPVSHVWGRLALELIERWDDRSLEAATRHVIFNLVCTWTVPLSTVLEPSREVFDIGRRTGDLEYASYAAHTYVYLALYCGRPLGALCDEALELGRQMRALGQINAAHVHAPFEQLLKSLTGRTRPGSLDDDGFSEREAEQAARAAGSRSGLFILNKAMGMARYFRGAMRDSFEIFERARPYIDAAPSCWLIPVFHQFAALAACGAWDSFSDDERSIAESRIDDGLAFLRRVAAHSRTNFMHRIELIEGERLRIRGDLPGAIARFESAIEAAERGDWQGDVALGHTLLLNAVLLSGDAARAVLERESAAAAHARWGAVASSE